nr:MAG TPA: hypothetical protein [Caudoviricetes sp.]
MIMIFNCYITNFTPYFTSFTIIYVYLQKC